MIRNQQPLDDIVQEWEVQRESGVSLKLAVTDSFDNENRVSPGLHSS